jgi:hypothetical protein
MSPLLLLACASPVLMCAGTTGLIAWQVAEGGCWDPLLVVLVLLLQGV